MVGDIEWDWASNTRNDEPQLVAKKHPAAHINPMVARAFIRRLFTPPSAGWEAFFTAMISLPLAFRAGQPRSRWTRRAARAYVGAMRELFNLQLMGKTALTVVLPLVGGFVVWEAVGGEVTLSKLMVVLAATLPFAAVGWLAYQHLRAR